MNKFINILLILLVIIIAFIAYFAYKTYYNPNRFDNLINSSRNSIENITSENQIASNNLTPSEETKTVKYEFTSADSFAMQGNPGIFKIFDLNTSKMEFEYNHGWNFAESTIDRKVAGIAKLNEQNLYEFVENIDGHKYSIIIDFSEKMIALSEYIDENLISRINLWS